MLIADDHPPIRAGLVALLDGTADICIAAEASDAFEIEAALRRSRPDVVLLDNRLPGRSGVAICRSIKRQLTPPAVAIYSAFGSDHLLVPALLAGADALIDKGAAATSLIATIRRLASGERLVPEIDPEQIRAAAQALSDDDRPLLGMLIHGASRREVATTLHLSADDVEHRVDRVLSRLLADRLPG